MERSSAQAEDEPSTTAMRWAALATRYAQAGKPRLAAASLRRAEEAGPHASGRPDVGLDAALQAARAALSQTTPTPSVPRDGAPPPRTVLLFGLSADPPTASGGHAGIVAWGARTLRVDLPDDVDPAAAREQVPIDEVWVLPVYRHAFASKSKLLPFEHRYAMARLAFEALPGLEGRVRVKDSERTVVEAALARAQAAGTPVDEVRVGTIDVVRHLVAEHPDAQFVLALGGDTYADLIAGKWKEGDALQALVPIVVVRRAGVEDVGGHVQEAPALTDVSSSEVRASTDLEFLRSAVHPAVLDYIREHGLYALGGARGPPGDLASGHSR